MENVIKNEEMFKKAVDTFMDKYFYTTVVNGVVVVDATKDYWCPNFDEIFVDDSYSFEEGYNKFLENVKLLDSASNEVCEYIHDSLLVDRLFDDAFGLDSFVNIFENDDYELFLDAIAQEVFGCRVVLVNPLQLFFETLEEKGFNIIIEAVDK